MIIYIIYFLIGIILYQLINIKEKFSIGNIIWMTYPNPEITVNEDSGRIVYFGTTNVVQDDQPTMVFYEDEDESTIDNIHSALELRGRREDQNFATHPMDQLTSVWQGPSGPDLRDTDPAVRNILGYFSPNLDKGDLDELLHDNTAPGAKGQKFLDLLNNDIQYNAGNEPIEPYFKKIGTEPIYFGLKWRNDDNALITMEDTKHQPNEQGVYDHPNIHSYHGVTQNLSSNRTDNLMIPEADPIYSFEDSTEGEGW